MTSKTQKSTGKKVLSALMWLVLALAAAVLILLWPNGTALRQELPETEKGEWSSVASPAWMARLDGEMRLSEISMPGSHDSGTEYALLPLIARCQDCGIRRQLDMGVRVLDIRLNSKSGENGLELYISHGFVSCKSGGWIFSPELRFADVLSDCEAFLSENPTETVLMLLKHENGEGTAAEIQAAVDECVGDGSPFWYDEAADPVLDDVRGKIVLARRYGEADSGLPGLDFCWEKQNGSQPVSEPCAEHSAAEGLSLWVQDRYEYETEDKWSAVASCLDESHEGFSINYLSTKGSAFQGIPAHYAKALNPRFAGLALESGENTGIVMFDFVTQSLAEMVYSTNSMK